MLSLRTVARSAPRFLTKAVRPAARTSTLFSTQSARAAARQSSAAFSTSVFRRAAAGEVDEELSAKLASEIEYENDVKENEPLPASIKDFLENGPFEIQDTAGKEEVTLTRTFGNEKYVYLPPPTPRWFFERWTNVYCPGSQSNSPSPTSKTTTRTCSTRTRP